jgi:hypothetical protein
MANGTTISWNKQKNQGLFLNKQEKSFGRTKTASTLRLEPFFYMALIFMVKLGSGQEFSDCIGN